MIGVSDRHLRTEGRVAMKRRDMVKAAVGVAAVAAVPTAIGAAAATGRLGSGEKKDAAAEGGAAEHVETYKGRTIRVVEASGAHQAVYIDDRPLHVMKLGENAYMSSMCHYGLEASPLVAARRAVDELRGAQLLAAKVTGPARGGSGNGGGHGNGHGA